MFYLCKNFWEVLSICIKIIRKLNYQILYIVFLFCIDL